MYIYKMLYMHNRIYQWLTIHFLIGTFFDRCPLEKKGESATHALPIFAFLATFAGLRLSHAFANRKTREKPAKTQRRYLPTNLQWSSTIKPGGNPWVIGVYLDTFSRFSHHFLLESSGGTAGPGKVQLGELHHGSASLCQGGAWPWSLGPTPGWVPKMVPPISTPRGG